MPQSTRSKLHGEVVIPLLEAWGHVVLLCIPSIWDIVGTLRVCLSKSPVFNSEQYVGYTGVQDMTLSL